MPGVERSKRHAHEIDKVVACEGECEREGACKNDKGEDVCVLEKNRSLHEQERNAEDREQNRVIVRFQPLKHFGRHEGSPLGALHHEEVDDRRHAECTEKAAENAVGACVVEREEKTHHELHDKTCDECDNDRDENRHDHRKGLGRIHVEGEIRNRQFVRPHFEAGKRHRAAQEFKNDRNGGGGGQTE